MADSIPSSSIDEHLERVLAEIHPLPARSVALGDALGRILATDVYALVDVPGFDNSAMDGYAVRYSDVALASDAAAIRLNVTADLPAGSGEDPALGSGDAARIMTGAPVPASADYIVPVEDTDGGTDTVSITAAPEGRSHVRRQGSDVRVGALVLSAGRVLSSRDLAAAAAVGHPRLRVYPQARVAVISTGSELVGAGESLARGQIYDSNSWLLAAAVAEMGAIPVRIPAVPDDEEELRATLERTAGTVDMIITSGGVSVGAYDVVKAVLAPLSSMWFGPVRMQPGKPQGFGRWPDGPPIFTLPGNPVSVFVSFEAFVAPALRVMQGSRDPLAPVEQGIAAEGWRCPPGRAQHMPARAVRRADGVLMVRPATTGGSGSHLVASLADANALAYVPESTTEVAPGDRVAVRLLGCNTSGLQHL